MDFIESSMVVLGPDGQPIDAKVAPLPKPHLDIKYKQQMHNNDNGSISDDGELGERLSICGTY